MTYLTRSFEYVGRLTVRQAAEFLASIEAESSQERTSARMW